MKKLQIYGYLGLLRLARDLVWTKLCYSNSRLLRRPLYIRGRKHIDLGHRLTTGVNLRIDAFPELSGNQGIVLKIGDDVELNDYVHIAAVEKVIIGNNVLMASKVFISDHNHGYYGQNGLHSAPGVPPAKRPIASKPVIIEDNVWIGEFVSILPGVTIGKGAIIGAMSVVTSNIPSNSIAIGSPARVIKQYNDQTNQWEKVM